MSITIILAIAGIAILGLVASTYLLPRHVRVVRSSVLPSVQPAEVLSLAASTPH